MSEDKERKTIKVDKLYISAREIHLNQEPHLDMHEEPEGEQEGPARDFWGFPIRQQVEEFEEDKDGEREENLEEDDDRDRDEHRGRGSWI